MTKYPGNEYNGIVLAAKDMDADAVELIPRMNTRTDSVGSTPNNFMR